MLTNNTTNNRKFADYIDGRGRNNRSEKPTAVAQIRSTGPITAHISIVPACSMLFKFRSLDHFSARMVEVGKDPDAPVCFDIPGGRKKRREAADLDPDATSP